MHARKPRRRVSRLWWLIVIIPVLLVLGVTLASVFVSNLFPQDVDMIQSRPVEGDPANFDPIARFDSLQAFAGEGAQLVRFDANFVRSDGTLDLTAAYAPYVIAEFVIAVDAPTDVPIGAGGGGTWYRTVRIDAYQPNQARRVTGSGGSYSYINEGMTRDVNTPSVMTPTVLSPPRCSLATLWQVAVAQGAPADAVATITYAAEGYAFAIRETNLQFAFGPDCALRAE